MSKIKVSDWILARLAQEGVKAIFFVPGGAAMHLNNAIANHPELEAVANLHEQASAIAAEAYARITGELGVCMVTAGPGGTNAVTGVAGAFLDSTACLFLSGQVKRADLKTGSGLRQLGVQEIDIVTIVSSVTKYAVTVTEPTDIRWHLEKAMHLARTGRRGPVWLDLPLDVQGAMIDPASLRPYDCEITSVDPGFELSRNVVHVLDLLNHAQRPVLIAGNGIRLAGAQDRLLPLVERLGIPVLTTWLGLDLIPDEHELFFGRPGSVAPRGANFALQNSDLVIALGSRLDMALTGYAHDRFARAARKVVVDIDPAEIGKLKMSVDVPIVADAGDFIRELDRQSIGMKAMKIDPWRTRCRAWKRKYPIVLPEHFAPSDFVTTYGFAEALSQELSEGSIIATGASGAGIEIFLLALRIKAGQRCFHNRGMGAMGYGLPSAIGACIGSGRKPTVCIDGDGGFQLNIQELETVARLNLPMKIFILDNQGYASIRTSQKRYFGRMVGSDPASGMTVPDTAKIAAAYGLKIARIASSQHLQESVRRVLAMDGPVLCDVVTPPEELRQPSLTSYQKPDGTMGSKPLEDLWPYLDREEFHSNMMVPPIED